MPITMQQSLERFVHLHYDANREAGQVAETCVNLLSDYLQAWSGLFQYGEGGSELELQDWERDLDDQMMQMFKGDTAPPAVDLGSLSIDQFDEEHLREFIGWYLLKDMAFDSLMLKGVLDMLQQWLHFALRQRALSKENYQLLIEILQETAPEAERATIAAHALQRLVLSGSLYPLSAAKSPAIECLFAATARISVAEAGEPCSHWLAVDEAEADRLPITLPKALHPYLQQGDVLQLCLAQHADGEARLVESGALFPASTWVDAVMMDRFDPSDVMSEPNWEPVSKEMLH